jgi:hypothetical protein
LWVSACTPKKLEGALCWSEGDHIPNSSHRGKLYRADDDEAQYQTGPENLRVCGIHGLLGFGCDLGLWEDGGEAGADGGCGNMVFALRFTSLASDSSEARSETKNEIPTRHFTEWRPWMRVGSWGIRGGPPSVT